MLVIVIAALVLIILSVDIIFRYRNSQDVTSVESWKGLVSYPLLVVIGAVSTISVGWVGWLLVVVSLLDSSSMVKFTRIPPADDQTMYMSSLLGSLLVSVTIIAELAVLAVCAKVFVGSAGALAVSFVEGWLL